MERTLKIQPIPKFLFTPETISGPGVNYFHQHILNKIFIRSIIPIIIIIIII